MLKIEKVNHDNLNVWANLCVELWPILSIQHFIDKYPNGHEVYFLAKKEDNYVGFANVSIRHGYVSGTNNKRVAFLEGIYVKQKYRRQKIATQLFYHSQSWAIDNGCLEIGSKCMLDSESAIAFYQHIGFNKVEEVVNFIYSIVE